MSVPITRLRKCFSTSIKSICQVERRTICLILMRTKRKEKNEDNYGKQHWKNTKHIYICTDRNNETCESRPHSVAASSLFVVEHCFKCLFRWLDQVNVLPHTLQAYGFSPVWVCKCCVKWPRVANCFWHWLHWNGFTLAWIRLCLAKWLELMNDLRHTSQV